MQQNITILGRVFSKKNSKQIFRTKGRTFVISSKAYQKFQADALTQLYTAKKNMPSPYSVDYTFLLKGKMSTDLDNLIASVNDILQLAGIIDDDKNITHIKAAKAMNHQDWKTKIIITSIVKTGRS